MNQHFNNKGFNYFTGATTLPATCLNDSGDTVPCIYYGIQAETAFTINATGTAWAKGYQGDNDFLGVEHPAGTYLMRFSSLVIIAGTGIALIE